MKPTMSHSEMLAADKARHQPQTSTPNPQPDTPRPDDEKPPLEFPADQRPGVPNERTPTQAKNAQAKNEGEGNRTADRAYVAGATKFARSGQVPARAQEAARAVDGPEGPALRKAEEQARNAGKP